MSKPKCMLTVDVEALRLRAVSNHVDTLIYGKVDNKEYGIGRMMDIADKHDVKMTFFVDFAECKIYGDAILEVGKYVVSRGHDLQVHCHYNFLEDIVGKPSWVSISENYYLWYKDDVDSKIMIDYVTEQYLKCTGKMPIGYRGGEYRFGIGVLKALKAKGYKADLSYNYLRPEILPINKQFVFENELIEFPIGVLPNKKPLNFNYVSLMPQSREEFRSMIGEYEALFDRYYEYYGEDAIATILMHSWSFLHNQERFAQTGLMDQANELMVEFFDYFIKSMKEKVEFISVTNAVGITDKEKLKIADFYSVFKKDSSFSATNLVKIGGFIKKKAGSRQIVIWGKGWMESTIFQTVNYHKVLKTAYYISNDADRLPRWRGKPVYKYEDVTIHPDTHFVFVVAQPTFPEIRESLKGLGFKEFDDYYDIQKKVPIVGTNGLKAETMNTCSICDSHEFETYNSEKPRRCSNCGSVERTRTIPMLFNDNIQIDFASTKILHISPSKPERLFFKNKNANVTTIDVRPECKVDIVADICNMPEVESESFDLVFANCVLNHVYDDEKALLEIKRVLKAKGTVLIWVLDSGTLKTVIHEDPTGWYGKENYEKYKIGTFRHYGETDFTEQLRRCFSNVRCFEKYDAVSDSGCKWYRCVK